jgi:hypothetical protein
MPDLSSGCAIAGWTASSRPGPEAARPFGGMGEVEMRRAVAYAWRHGFLTWARVGAAATSVRLVRCDTPTTPPRPRPA